jgi:hypothetical protein
MIGLKVRPVLSTRTLSSFGTLGDTGSPCLPIKSSQRERRRSMQSRPSRSDFGTTFKIRNLLNNNSNHRNKSQADSQSSPTSHDPELYLLMTSYQWKRLSPNTTTKTNKNNLRFRNWKWKPCCDHCSPALIIYNL